MKRYLFSTALLFFSSLVFSQKLSQVSLAGGLSYFTIYSDPGVSIRISPDGKILEYGTELVSDRGGYYAPKLQPYLGRLEYYGPQADSAFRGKVKSIGTSSITYYGSYETEFKAGKLRSIGTLTLDYYTNYDNAALRGKLRFIGSLILEYYPSIDDEAVRGKLKSIGSTPLKYYSSFDDRYLRGKIKSIGTVAIDYYTAMDRAELRGQLRSGFYRPNVGGITFILQ